MSDLVELCAHELLDAYARRVLSPVEVVDAVADRIDAVERVTGSFTTLCLEGARKEAAVAEAAWRHGRPRMLEGIPVGVKDVFDSGGVRTTYGSTIFADHVPGRDAEALARLRAAGAILVGKTQMHEFAWGITSYNPALGSARNPWATSRVAGGSSGGSATALAAHEVPVALGTDTGGSIRVPAAFCGVVGLKPTWGRVSAAGAWPLARSLDHPGPMARSPLDAAIVLEVIAGLDDNDPATADIPLGDLRAELKRGLEGIRVGVCADLHLVSLGSDIQAAFDDAIAALRAAGAVVVEVSLPEAPLVLPAFRVIQSAEALDVHRRAGLYPARRDEYQEDVRGRLDAATEVTIGQYVAAAADRQRVHAGFSRLFRACDVLLTPVSAGSPPLLGDEVVVHFGQELSFRDLVMGYTTPQDLVGLPACTVRAGFDNLGLPIGLQFTAAPWCEGVALRAAQAFFDATPEVQGRRPPLASAKQKAACPACVD